MSEAWLNPGLNLEELCQKFALEKRITIPLILRPERASAVREALCGDMPWTLCYVQNGQPYGVTAAEWATWSEEKRAEFVRRVGEGATSGFQFLYDHFALSDACQRGDKVAPQLRDFAGFLNSDEFVAFLRNVTGHTDGRYVDAHAARYGRGHFLNKHNDSQDPRRRVAYVFHFTEGWRADWGGTTHFMARDGSVTDTVVPVFNSLTLFSVPVLHYVSLVAPFAGAQRYSVTGWLYAPEATAMPTT